MPVTGLMTEPNKHEPVAHIGKGRLGEEVTFPDVQLEYPGWVRRSIDWTRPYPGERDRMRVALQVAQLNIEQKTGGPFGAALFDTRSGKLISVGLEQHVHENSLGHAELMAIALGARRLGVGRLEGPEVPLLELHTSVEPCLMCAGGILLSGLQQVYCASTAEDAEAIGRILIGGINHLEAVGITVQRGVLRDEARDVLRLYRAMRGPVI